MGLWPVVVYRQGGPEPDQYSGSDRGEGARNFLGGSSGGGQFPGRNGQTDAPGQGGAKLRAQTEHQRRQIHEMENTKVWRAYQGCRGICK